MKNFLNKAAHLVIGFLVGLHAEKPASRTATIAFCAYQGIEAYRKGDDGYPEIKEFAVGMGAGLFTREVARRGYHRRAMRWLDSRVPSFTHRNKNLARVVIGGACTAKQENGDGNLPNKTR